MMKCCQWLRELLANLTESFPICDQDLAALHAFEFIGDIADAATYELVLAARSNDF